MEYVSKINMDKLKNDVIKLRPGGGTSLLPAL